MKLSSRTAGSILTIAACAGSEGLRDDGGARVDAVPDSVVPSESLDGRQDAASRLDAASDVGQDLPDPCAGVTCEAPPSQCHASVGACIDGECEYPPLVGDTACDDGRACTEGDACAAGACVGRPICNDACRPCSGALRWARIDGGQGDQRFGAATILPDGDFVVCGTVPWGDFDIGGPNETQLRTTGLFLARYQADGSMRWAITAAEGDYEGSECTALVEGSDGAVIMIGRGGGYQRIPAGDPDGVVSARGFAASYDRDGSFLWLRKVGLEAHGAARVPDGGFVVSGFCGEADRQTGDFDVGDGIQRTIACNRFLGRYDADAQLQWVRAVGARMDEIHVVADGTFFVSGSDYSGDVTDELGFLDRFGDDYYVARFDGEGAPLWVTGVGGDADERRGYLAIGPDERVYLAVATQGTLFYGAGPSEIAVTGSPDDHYLALGELNFDTGQPIWAVQATNRLYSATEGWLAAVAASSSGPVLVAFNGNDGITLASGESTEMTLPTADCDFVLALFRPDGVLLDAPCARGVLGVSQIHVQASLGEAGLLLVGDTVGRTPQVFGAGEPNETTLDPRGYDVLLAEYTFRSGTPEP